MCDVMSSWFVNNGFPPVTFSRAEMHAGANKDGESNYMRCAAFAGVYGLREEIFNPYTGINPTANIYPPGTMFYLRDMVTTSCRKEILQMIKKAPGVATVPMYKRFRLAGRPGGPDPTKIYEPSEGDIENFLSLPRDKRRYHSVVVVGYGFEISFFPDGQLCVKPYYLVKNHWSDDWGYFGYLKVTMSFLERSFRGRLRLFFPLEVGLEKSPNADAWLETASTWESNYDEFKSQPSDSDLEIWRSSKASTSTDPTSTSSFQPTCGLEAGISQDEMNGYIHYNGQCYQQQGADNGHAHSNGRSEGYNRHPRRANGYHSQNTIHGRNGADSLKPSRRDPSGTEHNGSDQGERKIRGGRRMSSSEDNRHENNLVEGDSGSSQGFCNLVKN
ncbi:OLC1v1006643C1 [Oldenlandia corymbosa var. corymbosa]|uniref:OLC1v1006643C1 n=1 Tax=Oldenlandia corymbosa var. corymbosa TaxID=529605 RepID=A0AAV1DHH0_OLDCO|nr:OLC1v1006643C1 [Oldenlandia corymbosa var. corymbosa]